MSCAIPPLPYPAERLAVGPFSFLPPNEPDWVGYRYGKKQFVAARQRETPDESLYLIVVLVDPPDLSSDQKCLAKAREWLEEEPARILGRYQAQSAEAAPWTPVRSGSMTHRRFSGGSSRSAAHTRAAPTPGSRSSSGKRPSREEGTRISSAKLTRSRQAWSSWTRPSHAAKPFRSRPSRTGRTRARARPSTDPAGSAGRE